ACAYSIPNRTSTYKGRPTHNGRLASRPYSSLRSSLRNRFYSLLHKWQQGLVCQQATGIPEVHGVIQRIPIQVRVASSEMDRILRRPSPWLGVVIPHTEPRQPCLLVI